MICSDWNSATIWACVRYILSATPSTTGAYCSYLAIKPAFALARRPDKDGRQRLEHPTAGPDSPRTRRVRPARPQAADSLVIASQGMRRPNGFDVVCTHGQPHRTSSRTHPHVPAFVEGSLVGIALPVIAKEAQERASIYPATCRGHGTRRSCGIRLHRFSARRPDPHPRGAPALRPCPCVP
jgi:hypothetical protein